MKNKSSIRVCIVIPTYNEAGAIGHVVTEAKKALKKSPYSGDVVVINDGSKDDSAAIAHRNGAVVISHILNSGAGGATATGLSYAQQNEYDVAATMDADGQHDIKDVMRGINELIKRGDDLLIGSRLIDSKGMSRVKVLGNKGLSIITHILFGINSTDSQSGMRVFSRRALEQLRWKTNGYEFCSEMLWRAHQAHLKISEFPIKAIYTDYSKGKGQNNWNAINIVKSLIRRRIVEIFE